MGLCTYCRKPAGLFRNQHQRCADERQRSIRESHAAWSARLSAQCEPGGDAKAAWGECVAAIGRADAARVAQEVFIGKIKTWVQGNVRPGTPELLPVAEFVPATGINPRDLPGRVWTNFVMLIILADLADGKMPNHADDPGLGFMYERGETFVWCFDEATYLRDEVQHQRGLYAGVSMRVAPGMYSRLGTYQPGAVVEGLVPVSQGALVVTDRALWFRSEHGVQRAFLKDMTSVECFDDGFGFTSGRGSGRLEVYKTGSGEGWFAHQLVSELAKVAT